MPGAIVPLLPCTSGSFPARRRAVYMYIGTVVRVARERQSVCHACDVQPYIRTSVPSSMYTCPFVRHRQEGNALRMMYECTFTLSRYATIALQPVYAAMYKCPLVHCLVGYARCDVQMSSCTSSCGANTARVVLRRLFEEPTAMTTRPDFIRHWKEIQDPDNATYLGSDELLSIGSAFGRVFGFERLGVHHELLPPGRRTSWPHAERTEEELVYVIEGTPDVWLDGHLVQLKPGDAVGFKPGTGIAHTVINNSDHDVRLLVVGEHKRPDNQVHYPLHPTRNAEIGPLHWKDCPERPIGPHDGMPKR